MSNPNHSHSYLPARIVALTAAGVFSLAGCVEAHPSAESAPHQLEPMQTTSGTPTTFEGRLKSIREGICSQVGTVAAEDCLELPKVTDGATFAVITEDQNLPQASTGEVDEARKIAEVTPAGSELGLLSKDYKAAITHVVDNPFSREAVRQGTKIVFEQQEDEYYCEPVYLPEIDAVRIQLFTGTNDMEWAFAPENPSIGEIRATVIHESSHAVQAKWQKNTELDKKIDALYQEELRFAMEQIRTEHGPQIQHQLDEFERLLRKDFKQKDISRGEYKALLENSRAMRKMLARKNGFAAFAADDSEYGPYWQLPARVLVGDDYPDREDYEDVMKIESLDQAGPMNDIFRQYLAEYFSYGVEHKLMTGLLNKKTTLGHSWDNRGEFLASMTAVVEVAPDEAVAAVNNLSLTHKERVVRLINLIADKYKSENPSVFEASQYPAVVKKLS